MFHEQFEHQNVAHSMENERFSLKNAANTVDMAASSSKMLQIAPKCCKLEDIRGSNSKKIVERAPSCSKMLQITRKMDRIGNPKMGEKTIPDPLFFPI